METSNFIIRNVTIDDAAGVAQVQAEAWRTAYNGIVPEVILSAKTQEAGTPKFIEKIRTHIESQTNFPFLVAVMNEDIVGFAHSRAPREAPSEYDCELGAIYVDPVSHGMGVGSSLVCETAKLFKAAGFSKMIIWSFIENPWQRFYKKIGGEILPIHREKILGGKPLTLAAYSWTDLDELIRKTTKIV
jgi:GNAT superfamily N-acetyltransferase